MTNPLADSRAIAQDGWRCWGQALLLALLVQAGSLMLYSPALWAPPSLRFQKVYEPLSEDPWRKDLTAEPQVRHRMLGPIIAHYLGLRGLASTIPPIAANTLFLAVCFLICRRTHNFSTSLQLMALLATTLAVVSTQTWMGFQDSFGHLACALCMYFRRVFWVLPIILLGMLGDERCAASLPLVVCWHYITVQSRQWYRVGILVLIVIVSVILWFLFYSYINQHFVPPDADTNFKWQEIGLPYLKWNLNYIPLGIYEALRAAWILPIMLVPLWVKQGKYLELGGFLIALLLCLLQVVVVGDISRSCSFAWPAILIAAYALGKSNENYLQLMVKFALILNIFTPCYQIIGGSNPPLPQLYWPFPLALLRLLAGA